MPRFDEAERRHSWFASAEATVTVMLFVITLGVAGVYWGGHADSQIAQNKKDIEAHEQEIQNMRHDMEVGFRAMRQDMSANNTQLADKMDRVSERLIVLETKQAIQVDLLQNINANIHGGVRHAP
jgi:uncharacterized protein HemX